MRPSGLILRADARYATTLDVSYSRCFLAGRTSSPQTPLVYKYPATIYRTHIKKVEKVIGIDIKIRSKIFGKVDKVNGIDIKMHSMLPSWGTSSPPDTPSV